MSAKVLVVTSETAQAGKTHVAAGLARWLTSRGYHVAPLHLSSRAGDNIQCPEGGAVSRAAALLAEACGLSPATWVDSDWSELDSLRTMADVVVVEAPAPVAPIAEFALLPVRRSGTGIAIAASAPLPLFQPGLMPPPDAHLAHLPPWRLGGGPRTGIVSLPHISNFGEFQLVRGAEWLTVPAPGRFDVIFIPATSNELSDAVWLAEAGLDVWLTAQHLAGAKLIASGWRPAGAEEASGNLLDPRVLSVILGRRIPPPLPDEETLNRLGDWFGHWPGLQDFARTSL